MARKKVSEVKVSEDKETQEATVEKKIIKQDISEKKEKAIRVLDEIKAFLILAAVISFVVLAVWYWYTHLYNRDGISRTGEKIEEKVDEYKGTKYIAGVDHYLDVLDDKYVIEYLDNTLYKVMDMNSNILFDGAHDFDNLMIGTDGSLVLFTEADADFQNIITIKKLVDKEIKEVKTVNKSGVYFRQIHYLNENNNSELLGFYGTLEYVDDDLNEITSTYLYLIDDKEYELNDMIVVGEEISEKDVITLDQRYLIVKDIKTNLKGVYDLQNSELIIKPQYEDLYKDNDINYIVSRNGKYGIVTNRLKKILDFEYDFIDNNDEYYVVAKEGKMAIMNKDYKLVTKYEFDFQINDQITKYSHRGNNSFKSYKIKDKYVLSINANENKLNIDYPKRETYFINENGTYETIKDVELFVEDSLIYTFDKNKKEYTLYDNDLKKMYTINIQDYDYDGYAKLRLENDNTLVLELNSIIYYDYETGKEIDGIKDYENSVDGITIKYTSSDKVLQYIVNEKVIVEINLKNDKLLSDKYSTFYKITEDSMLHFATNKNYITIKKDA